MNSTQATSPATSSRPFPYFSILAVVAIPLFGFGSLPYWTWNIAQQIRTAPISNYSADPGQFGGLAVVAGVVGTAAIGAVFGLLTTWLAGHRNERCIALRVVAWIANGLGAAVGGFLIVSHLLKQASL